MTTRIVCAWCGRPVGTPPSARDRSIEVSHGICPECAGELEFDVDPVEDLLRLTEIEVDALPIGLLELDPRGVVLRYNRSEEELSGLDRADVVGRDFFEEIAPCTAVRAFRGRFDALAARSIPARDRFEFVFRFAHGERRVSISMVHDPHEARILLLVKTSDA